MVPSRYLEVLTIDQNPTDNVELPSFFNMKGTSFMVDALEDVEDVVVHCSQFVEPCFCGRRGEFVLVIQMNGVGIEGIKTSVCGEFVGSSGCSIVSKVCKR